MMPALNELNIRQVDDETKNEPKKTLAQLMENYKLSPEELRVLEECNKESFYQRCIPLSTMLGAGTYYGIQRGYLKGNNRFGTIPKVVFAVVCGYMLGKLSYRKKCAEKLMALPDSELGMFLRQKELPGGPRRSALGPSMFGADPRDVYSDAGPGSSLDLDTDRPSYAGLPEFVADVDAQTSDTPPDSSGKRGSMTYDELRKKNRDEHSYAQSQPYKMDTLPPSESTRPPIKHKNQYGDTVED